MKITCPSCGFNRDVPPERLPGPSVVATCPKCGKKFNVSLPQDEEEDIRQTAARAYQAEAGRLEKDAREAAANPWELAPWPAGWTQAFFQTLFKVLFYAPAFFANLPQPASLFRPLSFFSIITLFQSVTDRLWALFFIDKVAPQVMTEEQLGKILELFAMDDNFFLTILTRFGTMIFQLYLYSLILFIAYRLIAPQRAGFALIFQVAAYSCAPAVLCLVPVLGSVVGWIWSLVCLLTGLKAALRLGWLGVLIGFSPIVLLSLPVFNLVFNMMA